MADRFYVGPMNEGLQRDLKPFMISDTAFSKLQNAYLFRGSVRKRWGSVPTMPLNGAVEGYETLGSRMRMRIGTTDAAGSIAAIIPDAPLTIGGNISIRLNNDVELFTINQLGNPAQLLTLGPSIVHTIDTTTGAIDIQVSYPNADVYYYPLLPIMGIIQNETQQINYEETYVFDTRYSYHFTVDGWDRLGTVTWTGTDSNFFWGEVHRGVTTRDDVLFVANNVDNLRYFDAGNWVNLVPTVRAGIILTTCKLVASYKDRLLLFDVVENGDRFTNRVRFSQNGTPIVAADPDAWRDDIPGKGGFTEVPSQQAIISVKRLADKLIVFCERSTWELVYTGNAVKPFVWRQIDSELGVESTHSLAPFTNVILGVGNIGIHACNGSNLNRIDEKIPDEVFKIHNEQDGVSRVAAIKDNYLDQVYWTFPTAGREVSSKFPDRVLIYNYLTETWAFFDDSITAFGYEQRGQRGRTWAELIAPLTWETWLDPWGEPTPEVIARNRNILAGNQQGFVFVIMSNEPKNAPALQVIDMITGTIEVTMLVPSHNLQPFDYVSIANYVGITVYDYNGEATLMPINVVVSQVLDDDTIVCLFPFPVEGVYLGGSVLARVSRIDIQTKEFNFYANKGQSLSLKKLHVNVDNTKLGEIGYDYSFSGQDFGNAQEAYDLGVAYGIPIILTGVEWLGDPTINFKQFWRTLDIQGVGETVQIRIYNTDEQMLMQASTDIDFQLNAMIFECSPAENL
jgi:hypothetical protein